MGDGPVAAVREEFLTRDPVTGREFVHAWGMCVECERETLLYQTVGGKRLRCGRCLPLSGRSLV